MSIDDSNVEEILGSIYDTIIEENSINCKKIFSEDNFKKRFSCDTISDLDFTFKYIQKEFANNKGKMEFNDTQNKWIRDLKSFYKSFFRISFVFGPKGIGKTNLILYYLQLHEIPRLYFSIKEMSNFIFKKWKKIALYESIYAFDDLNQMNEFIEKIQDINLLKKFKIFKFIQI